MLRALDDEVNRRHGNGNERDDKQGSRNSRPAFRVRNRAETVRAQRASHVAAAVKKTGERARIYLVTHGKRYERRHNVVRGVREEGYEREADENEYVKRRADKSHYRDQKGGADGEVKTDLHYEIGNQRMNEHARQRSEHTEHGQSEREEQRQTVSEPERLFHYGRHPRLQAVF